MARNLNPMVAAAGAAAALVPTWAWAHRLPDSERYGPHMMWWGEGWHGMVFGPLFMILVLAAVIAVAVLLVRWLGVPRQGPVPPGRTALDILKERFARGEIDKNEYEERRRVLGD
jgi:putative membrane protein